jgi:transglutaminase-like putative cysteine protease
MNLAPNPQLHGQIVQLSNGMAGVKQTLAAMRHLVEQGKKDLNIRQSATQIVFLTPEKNQFAEAEAIFNFVRDSIRYVRDINGVETLQSPVITLQTQMGDCDDQTTLLASMLEAVGYATRFVVAGYIEPNHYEHVYMQAYLNNQWVDMDATEHQAMGWSPPYPVALAFEAV